MITNGIIIKSAALAAPPGEFSNEDLVRWHGQKSADWIFGKLGVRSRHSFYDYRLDQHVNISEEDLLVDSTARALAEADCTIEDIDLIVLVTSTMSHTFPDSACTVHRKLGAKSSTFAFTVTSGCAGTLIGLSIANQAISSGAARRVLVCGAATSSGYFRPHIKDKVWLLASIFGDGVASLVVEAAPNQPERGFTPFYFGAKPEADVAVKKYGGFRWPIDPSNVEEALYDAPVFDLPKVPPNLVQHFGEVYETLLARNGLKDSEVDWILFNMSNAVVQRKWLEQAGINPEKGFFNMDKFGNCAAASLGIAISDFMQTKKPRPGQVAAIMAVGTGLQYGGTIYRF